MGKIEIGILVFTDKIKERGLSSDIYNNKKYWGLKSIINDLDKDKYNVNYISECNINKYEYVLLSIISYYDALNYINLAFSNKIKSKLIVGGPYVLNHHVYKDSDSVCLGRGENQINGIMEKTEYSNVIIKTNIKANYRVRELEKFLCIGNLQEKSVGCKAKCFFCQYAWKNKYKAIKEGNYQSSYSAYEDYIQNVDVSKNGRYVTAIDGLTEYSRYKVNKRISNKDIEIKLEEIANNNIRGMLKIYNIIGYPWETKIDFSEFIEIVKKIDIKQKERENKFTLYLTHTHFVPKLLTPMENVLLNIKDFRAEIVEKPVLFTGKFFKVANNIYITSSASAAEEYIVDRVDNDIDLHLIYKIFCNKKYIGLDSKSKINNIKHYFGKYLNGYSGDYNIEYPHKNNLSRRFIEYSS